MSSLSQLAVSIENKIASNLPARFGNCSVDSCLTSNGSPVSPMGSVASQAVAALKKRPRPLFSNGDSIPLEWTNC
ncbi:hypothetical protein HYC85_012576 [Camellia sinensis]|uniref:Uncharacterized protein n=2 Tax=Camellia sinensis TaxID=4442 RepID=A0A7J7HCB8_CAMSI|nr:hypothetical protein HYC85_012576 [Camellia sinensis]